MIKLADMSVTEGASKALEVLIYSDYEDDKAGKYSWRPAFTGSFDEYLKDSYEYEEGDLDQQDVWQELMHEGSDGTRDNWTAKIVATHGGEGEGDQYWMVVSVSDGETTRYFRRDGWYASYDGGYLDGETYEVKPQERLVTFYE